MLELDVEGEWNSKDGQFSPNVNAVILPMHKSSLKLGVDSLGYDNLFNLQYRMGDGAIKPRIGVVRSKLGLGTDINLGKAAGIYVDAYDPRDVQVDITGRLMMPKDFYLHGGIRDAFDRKNPVFGVGKRF
jgi:phospholipid/cholesterol/gamma-HCH transport system substrate-binding protein